MKNFIFVNIILIIFIPQISLSQRKSDVKNSETRTTGNSQKVKSFKQDVLNPENNFSEGSSETLKIYLSEFSRKKYFFNKETDQNKEPVLIRNNISIGGFINGCAVINYKPEMKSRPSEFITLYASHNIMSLIPLNEMKHYYRIAAAQSAVFFIIDNSVNLFLYKGNWLAEIAGFTVKSIMMNLFFNNKVKERNRNLIPWISDEYYYYSVSIKF